MVHRSSWSAPAVLRGAVGTLVTVVLLIYTPLLANSYRDERGRCVVLWNIKNEHEEMPDDMFPHMHTAVNVFIPFVPIVICNMINIRQLCASTDERVAGSRVQIVRLVLVSVTFVLCRAPGPITDFLVRHYNTREEREGGLQHYRWLTFVLLPTRAMLPVLKASCNLLLYCMAGPQFRAALRAVLLTPVRYCCRRRRHQQQLDDAATTSDVIVCHM